MCVFHKAKIQLWIRLRGAAPKKTYILVDILKEINNICIHEEEKKLYFCSLCPLRPGGGLKALTDMSAGPLRM